METTATMKNDIGSVISIREQPLNYATYGVKKHILPVAETLIQQIDALEMGEVTQEIWNELVTSRHCSTLKNKYIARIEKETAKLPQPVKKIALSDVDATFKTLSDTLDKLFEAKLKVFVYTGMANTMNLGDLDLTRHIQIIHGRSVFDEQEFQKQYQIRIENPEQGELWEKLQLLKSMWDEAVDFVRAHGYDVSSYNTFFMEGGRSNGFVYEGEGGYLQLDPESIFCIK